MDWSIHLGLILRERQRSRTRLQSCGAQCYKTFFHRKSRHRNFPQIFQHFQNHSKTYKASEKHYLSYNGSERRQLRHLNNFTICMSSRKLFRSFGEILTSRFPTKKSFITLDPGWIFQARAVKLTLTAFSVEYEIPVIPGV